MGFTTHDGTRVTSLQITRAYWAGECRIQQGYGSQSLRIDGAELDTRDSEPMMSSQAWTRMPIDLRECLQAAGGNTAWREEQAQIDADVAAAFASIS